MFYCDLCRDERDYPDSFLKSHGECEICGMPALCNDVPTEHLRQQEAQE